MPNTLKIKRGLAASIPQGQLAEPLFTTDTYDLYIGKGAGGNQRIQNYIASGTSSQFLKGDGSLDSTTYQATSEKGQNNGYASLDAGGKIPAAQLPSSVIEYKGTWNASTNTPTLADGTGDAGDVYIVSVGGTQNLGSGSITFDAGDWVMYNGSVWQKSTGSNAVASVNGQTGIVSIGVNDLDDATITSVSNGQLLQYSTGTNKWVNWTPTYISAAITSLNGLTGATQTFANDTNVTITSATSTHTIGWSGQLSIARGGTGLSALGTAGQLLRVNSGATALEYFTPTYISAAITSLNGLTAATQTFAVGTSGTDFAISSSTSTHTFNLPTASATNRGALSSADWSTFNTKQNAITLTTTGSSGAATLVGATLNIPNYGSALSGYLPLTGGTLTGGLIGTTASFTSNSGNFTLGSQADTAIYTHFGSKSASGGQAVAMRLAGTLTATANFDNLFGLWVDYTDNTAGYAGVTRYGIYQNDSAKRNYFGGPTTFNSAVTGSDTITATAFIPTGTSVPSRGMYTSASNVLDFSAGTTNLLSLNYNTSLSTFNTGVRGNYFRIVNVSTAEFGINTENNQGYIGTTTSHGFNIMTNNTPRLEFHATTGAATFSSSVTAGQGLFTSTSYPLDLTANTNNYGIRLTSVQAPSLLLYSTYNTANNRNWGIFTNYAIFGDFAIAQSNAKDGDLTTGANGTARLYIKNDGNVGIGTTSPGAKLHIYGTETSPSLSTNTGIFTVHSTSTVQLNIGGNNSSPYPIWLQTRDTSGGSNSYPLLLNPLGGNVGIGTTSPSTNLHIYSTGTGETVETLRLDMNTGAIPTSAGLNFRFGSVNGATIYGVGENGSTGASSMRFYTHNGTSSAERMRISSGGYLKASNNGVYNNSTGSYHELRTNLSNDNVAYFINAATSNPYGPVIYFSGASPNDATRYFLYCFDTTVERATIRSNGGLANYSANNVNLASDIRLKKDISILSSEWNRLKQIEVVNFKYKDSTDPTSLYGAIAQQVQEIYPELVIVTREATETEPEYYGIREQPFQWITTKVLQEAMEKIEVLESELDILKNK